MESLQVIYPMIVGYTVTPFIKWLKTKVNYDVPAFWYLIVLILNALIVFGIALVVAPNTDGVGLEALLQFLIAQVTSQGAHAIKKTKDKAVATGQ